MKIVPRLALLLLALTSTLFASPLADNITAEALIVTKAELRRHMAAGDDDSPRPATYRELDGSLGAAQPNYLIVRFLMKRPSHYTGAVEVEINGNPHTKLNVALHFNKGWVEYFIPSDSEMYGPADKEGGPIAKVTWTSLHTK